MIACKEAVQRLWDYLDRHLDEREDLDVEQHLGLCRHCCGELEFAKQVRSRLAATAATPLPAETRSRLESMLRRINA